METVSKKAESDFEIHKIEAKGAGKYNVYFSFADFPITMNETYLNHIKKIINKNLSN